MLPREAALHVKAIYPMCFHRDSTILPYPLKGWWVQCEEEEEEWKRGPSGAKEIRTQKKKKDSPRAISTVLVP